jgi:hypothetical protein
MNFLQVLVEFYDICEMRHRNIWDRIWRPPFRGANFCSSNLRWRLLLKILGDRLEMLDEYTISRARSRCSAIRPRISTHPCWSAATIFPDSVTLISTAGARGYKASTGSNYQVMWGGYKKINGLDLSRFVRRSVWHVPFDREELQALITSAQQDPCTVQKRIYKGIRCWIHWQVEEGMKRDWLRNQEHIDPRAERHFRTSITNIIV